MIIRNTIYVHIFVEINNKILSIHIYSMYALVYIHIDNNKIML